MNRNVLALVALLGGASVVVAEESVYSRSLKSTVWIVQPVSREGNMVSLRMGSGSLIDARQRLVLTNYHVVEDIDRTVIFFPAFDRKGKLIPEKEKYMEAFKAGTGIEGKVIARDRTKDLAIIKLDMKAPLPASTPAFRLAKDSPSPGDRVHSIGSPGISGAVFNYTDGAVKAVYDKKWTANRMANDPMPLQLNAKVIETSSGTNKGDSGGPLLNDKCELVGVTQGGSFGGQTANPISYFIDVSEVKEVLKKNRINLSNGPTIVVASETTKSPAPAPTPAADDPASKEQSAQSKLDLAKSLAAAGKVDKARERYRDIIKQFPGTKAADEAAKLLDQ